jgi:acylaminoacyl-peptidase
VRSPEELILFPVDSAGEPLKLAAPDEIWLAGRNAGAVEEASGIQAWITKPPGFDASKKYPLLLDFDDAPRRMCGGEFRLRAQIFAAAGFVVLCVNPRGTPGYGETYGNLLHSRFPGDDFDDLMRAVDTAAARPYVDGARLHIAGGLVAAWAIGHTDRFRSAVTRRAIADWTLDIATAPDGPRRAAAWLGAFPWTDAAQYTSRSPIYAAQNFKTPTLVIAQEHDPAARELYFALQMRKVESHLATIGDKPSQAVLELEATLAWLGK